MRGGDILRGVGRAALVALALACGSTAAAAQSSPLWGDLKPGPYRVGYRALHTYDSSRAPVADAAGRGRHVTRGRQMQISVWYPARAASGPAPRMRFGDYVHLLARDVEFGPATAEQRRLGEKRFVEQPAELGGDGARLGAALPSLLRLETAATRDAPAVPGRFPLVVFPDYRSPATNSVMCEYLASHGFVVASHPLKGTHEVELDVAVTGIETMAADMRFVIGTLNESLPSIERGRVALAGVGITASGCMALLTRSPEVDALVSLDGGIPTQFEDRMLKRTPYFDISAVRVPLLAVHAPHPNVEPAILDQYKYSTRHLVHFPRMSEFHFLNYGMLERFAPGIIGKPPGDTKAGFEWAAAYVLHFLKAYLRGDAGSLAFLRAAPEANGAPAGLVTVRTKDGLKAPPTLPELKAMFRQGGIGSVVAHYRLLKKDDPQPFSQEKFVDFHGWLSYRRDPDWKARRELALLRVESYPDSTRAHFTLAQVAVQLKEGELARKHFNEALRLLPADADPALESATRRRIEQIARQNLESP